MPENINFSACISKTFKFFVNKNNASFDEMNSLINFVKKVKDKTGINMNLELNCRVVKKILLLAGGYSNEREISLETAKSVYSELLKNKKYKLKIQEPNGNKKI